MRIVISGGSGTGKTTLARNLAEYLRHPYIPDMSDYVLKERGFFNWLEVPTWELGKEMRLEALDRKIELEKREENFVSDKGVIDYLAYWLVHSSDKADESENSAVLEKMKSHSRTYERIIIPEFGIYPVVRNRKRNSNFFHRLKIHSIIKGLYDELGFAVKEYNYRFGTPMEQVVEDLDLEGDYKPKVGLYLGTFDPFHKGHRKIVLSCRNSLDEIWIQPHPDHPHPQRHHQPLETRARFIELSIADLDRVHLRVDPVPEHHSLHYREATVLHVLQEFPGFSFVVVMGSDKLTHRAYESGPLLEVPHYVFLRRELSEEEKARLNGFKKARLIPDVGHVTSATGLRESLKQGVDVREFLHPNVYEYIKMQGTYL